jgi:N-acetylglucosaminyldiphosphoundecaprenol N-acetyl-beta-D-mannosaminyltransferase
MYERVNILGVWVSAININQTKNAIEDWIKCREFHYICVTPAHTVMDCWRDPDLRKIVNASGLTTPDGMSIVWLILLKGYRHVERVYGPDLMLEICDLSTEQGYRNFFYGGAPGVADRLVARLEQRFTGLQIAGTYSPPYRPLSDNEDIDAIEIINESRADIVWVGLGSPKQEQWMAEHIERLNAPVLIGVGAAFDFLSGHKAQAPRWMQRSGFEWLFRLVTEPKRLWRRYAQYPLFILLVVSQLLGLQRYSE